MRIITTVMLLVCISFAGQSQNSATEGTFQLMTTNPKAQEVFTTDILEIIENSRLIDAVSIVKVGDFTWVRILSVNTINDPSFTPLSDEIIVIDPDDVIINSPSNESNH